MFLGDHDSQESLSRGFVHPNLLWIIPWMNDANMTTSKPRRNGLILQVSHVSHGDLLTGAKLRREISGMIHQSSLVINNHPSNPHSQPIQQPYVKRTSKYVLTLW